MGINTVLANKSIAGSTYELLTDRVKGTYGVEFGEGLPIIDALTDVKNEQRLQAGVAGDKQVIERFIADLRKYSKIENIPKVKRLLDSGSSAIVFETEAGDVLKITQGNHFPMNRPLQSFDVPIFKRWKNGKTYVYLEEKIFQHGMSSEFVQMLKENIRKAGFRTSDMAEGDIHQLGISKNGKLYLLDPECAKYKTIFHAMFDKLIRIIRK